jgi:hypothetical protein
MDNYVGWSTLFTSSSMHQCNTKEMIVEYTKGRFFDIITLIHLLNEKQ